MVFFFLLNFMKYWFLLIYLFKFIDNLEDNICGGGSYPEIWKI